MTTHNEPRQPSYDISAAMQNPTYLGTVDYINDLFSRYARLLVVRLDLGYRENSEGRHNPYRCWSDFDQLRKNRRHKTSLFGTQVGYVWRLEYGPVKGFHYHYILFFDGSKSNKDLLLGNGIGEYWCNEITHGEGVYWNSNLSKESFTEDGVCGVGMIHYTDTQLRNNLLNYVLPYLTFPDDQIRQYLPDGGWHIKTFSKGLKPSEVSPIRLGRPRQGVAF